MWKILLFVIVFFLVSCSTNNTNLKTPKITKQDSLEDIAKKLNQDINQTIQMASQKEIELQVFDGMVGPYKIIGADTKLINGEMKELCLKTSEHIPVCMWVYFREGVLLVNAVPKEAKNLILPHLDIESHSDIDTYKIDLPPLKDLKNGWFKHLYSKVQKRGFDYDFNLFVRSIKLGNKK